MEIKHSSGEGLKMFFIDYFNKKVKRLNIYDIKLIQGAAMALAIILVKLIPQIMELSIWWFVALLALFLIRPFYMFYIKA
jgi:hypothetical protein